MNFNVNTNGTGISAGISTPGINAGISTPGIGVGVNVKGVFTPVLMVMPNGKINTRSYRCNAITTIVFSCLAPWGCISYVISLRTIAVIMVIMSIVIQVGMIVASCLALHMPQNRSGWKGRRIFILVMCSIGAAFYTASVAVFIAAIIYVRVMLTAVSDHTLTADDGDIAGTVSNILFYIVIGLFVFDFGFKAPLIINSMLLGTKVFKLYK